jgi:lipoprotein-releasing system ATP-binding protein
MNNEPIIIAQQLSKTYYEGQNALQVLRGVDLTIARGVRIAIVRWSRYTHCG